MRVGLVFGTFAPMHLGHLDVVNIAKEEMDKVIVVCCGHEGDRGYPMFPLEKRYELAKEQFADDKKVLVTLLPDTEPEIKKHWDQQQIWNYWVDRMLLHLFQKGYILAEDELLYYTSEADYAQLLEATPQHIKVHLCERKRPVSGTIIRQDIDTNIDLVASSFAGYIKENILNNN
ncbi:adenylyltransferase/cytidyltransferase family protein [Butyrivibrio sp. YAB3001]|uniref:adenylyltransferase/cytidyltransferase family protein n=1 Tax=Butyrivibrio sp. YAB3001 TaxID=1520812 RepID=UPI0008F64B27|nr:adenylyltransferase/cytidyltransferase family protein [Butyrivibrio sp. YAB3001]SFB83820.1 Phosphopantetheine adenylyltransferase [Butyrivibrio sp. YAB3001]